MTDPAIRQNVLGTVEWSWQEPFSACGISIQKVDGGDMRLKMLHYCAKVWEIKSSGSAKQQSDSRCIKRKEATHALLETKQ